MSDSIETMFAEPRQRDNTMNVQRAVSKVWESRWAFVVCVVVAVLCAYVYLRYTTPRYEAHAKVLIKSDQQDASNGALLAGLGIHSGSSNIESEVEIFKSRMLMKRVVEGLRLNISYYVAGKIQTTNLYDDAPFRIIPLFADSSIQGSYKYEVTAKDAATYEIASGSNKWTVHFNDTVTLNAGPIFFEKNPLAGHLYDGVKHFQVTIQSADAVTDAFLNSLIVTPLNKQSNILVLSMQDVSPQRAEDVLDRLIEEYKLSSVDDKKQVAEGTVNFIDERLTKVGSELTGVEKDIEQFKVSNSLTNVETQSKELLDRTTDNSRELMQKEVQLRVLESLESYINNSSNIRRVMPATLIAQDATLAKIIEDYNSLQAQRQKMLLAYTENSSYVRNIDIQLDDLRTGMKNYIASLRKGYQVSVDELKMQAGIIESRIRSVPGKERVYLDYERQQQIKQELYLFLLKKREETALSKSATVANLKIVDAARRDSNPVSPNRKRILLMALVTGLMIPGVVVAGKTLFDNRITTKADIEQGTNLPIFAEISHNNTGDIVTVTKSSRTIVAEQFRTLRTNLQFLMQRESEKVILLTSSMSGEGKSFISINLASAIALSGKKVVLVELDLRKPKIAQHLGIKGDKGFSSYAVGQLAPEDIIIPSGVDDNFSVITTGPVPPNPSELIMLPKVQELFAVLRKQFDYIIIDTAPIGLVTDAQLLGRNADATMYVVRQGYTSKQQLKAANDLHLKGKLRNMGLIINDVNLSRRGEYGYGYGNNGAGYFEGENTSTTSKLKKILKRT